MAKLKHVYSEIEKTVIPSLTDGILELNSAIRISSSIIIPSRFRYSSIVKELHESLRSTKEQLSEVKNWLIFSNGVYNNAISDVETKLYGIEQITIKKRDMIVR